jgi:hypothetical protein
MTEPPFAGEVLPHRHGFEGPQPRLSISACRYPGHGWKAGANLPSVISQGVPSDDSPPGPALKLPMLQLALDLKAVLLVVGGMSATDTETGKQTRQFHNPCTRVGAEV